ncbi:cytochrome P450 2K6-like isoform X1 [Pelobates fuscus]|uniref:cytochrome P450 2K6-like isoform X1 n=2 Tax=Pelobates fuscus TaxID=191477 RepID=UPI002FE4E9E6
MDTTLYTAICVVLTLAALYIFSISSNWNKNSKPPQKKFPPGPRRLPFIGNLHNVDLKKPHLAYFKLSKIYGPVFSIQLGSKRMVILAGYETVRDALVNHAAEFSGRALAPMFQKMDHGNGIVWSNGENWKVMRRFTISTLRDFGMGKSSIEEKITEECSHLIQHFESFKGKPFDNAMILNGSVANIIVSVLLGKRMDYEDNTFLRLLKLVNENVQLLGSPQVALYNIFPFIQFLPGDYKKLTTNLKELFAFIKSTFVEHMKNLDILDPRSIVDAFLVRQKQEKENSESYFHNDNLSSLVRNLFSAGMETTSTTLRWGLLLMIKYPHVQEKVQEEISQIIGLANPSYNHRGDMPYTNAVVHEIQRFADVVPLNVPHETTKDVIFKGYFIPKGTYVIPLLTSVLRDKTQFDYPEEFNPNNFLDSEGNFLKKDAFIPFSAGRRVCAGENLARMELFIFFASLLQKFTFHLPPGITDVNLDTLVGFTNTPTPQKICAISRY